MVPRASLEAIQDFLVQKRIAMVGISRNAREFSRVLFDELCRRGYDMVPVNPAVAGIAGRCCFPRVQDIRPAVDAVLLMTSPFVTEAVVRHCAEAGVRRLWMHSAGDTGAVSERALAFCRERGIQVVAGECPYMFLPNPGLHVVHGWIRKLRGHYPQRAA